MAEEKNKLNQTNNNQQEEWEERVVEIKRTSKKTKGGNRIGFTALVVVGDGKGKVGFALEKARDVASAIKKAMRKAKKNTIVVPLKENRTIPHQVEVKFKAARVMMKPGRKGTGLIAGSVVRTIAEVAGIEDLTAKILGTNNKYANVQAVFKGFSLLKK